MFYLYKPGKNEGWIFCFRARQSVFHVDEPAMKSETVFHVAKLAQMNLNFVFSNLPIQTLILVFNL